MKTLLTISMLQFFDTFCLGIAKHLTSQVLMFSSILQGQYRQMIDSRWSGGLEDLERVESGHLLHQTHFSYTPCSIYYLPAPSFCPNLFFIPSMCRTFWPAIQLTFQRVFRDCALPVWLPVAGTSSIKFATQGVRASGCGTWKIRLLVIKTKYRNILLILTLL